MPKTVLPETLTSAIFETKKGPVDPAPQPP